MVETDRLAMGREAGVSEEYKGGMVLFFPDDPHSFGYVDLGGGYLICAPSGIPAMGLPREAIDKLPHVAAIIAERDELRHAGVLSVVSILNLICLSDGECLFCQSVHPKHTETCVVGRAWAEWMRLLPAADLGASDG